MHKWLYRLIVLLGCTQAVWLVAQTCNPVIRPADLKGVRPTEIVPPGTHDNCNFLQFAWQGFLAMNWPPLPADPGVTHGIARGLPDPSKVIGQSDNGDNRTVWEQDQPNWYLFWPRNPPPPAADGQSFVAWNRHAWLPAACGPLEDKLPPGSEPPRILSALSKFDGGMPGVLQAKSSAPLIDQDGYYARYEILMDYPAFNYINANQFYLLDKLEAFAQKGQPFSFPVQDGSEPGATLIKAAWKTLSAEEINSHRYHTAQAFLYTPTASGIEPTCAGPVTVGLVGLHIVQKTRDFPKWIWATFEQVDTTPADPNNLPPKDPPAGWGFFKRGSSVTPNQKPNCPDGVTEDLTKCDFQPTSSHVGQNPNDKTGGPTQAVRSNPIPKSLNQPSLGQINQAAQDALRQINPNSVWQYYQLTEAQWQGPTAFFPTKAANLTMETYTQSISCMSCHNPAKAPDSGKQVSSDMMFEFGLAWQNAMLPASRLAAVSSRASSTGKKGGTK
jgi:hypothetical protein